MANDAIQAIKQLRREVVDGMRTLMKLAKEKKTSGMLPICDDMIAKVLENYLLLFLFSFFNENQKVLLYLMFVRT